jgi:hypothetical protein
VNAVVQVVETTEQTLVPVLRPGHAIDSGACFPLELLEARVESLRCDMMQQGSKPYLLIPSCYLPYAFETIDTRIRRCVRGAADYEDVPLDRSPSLHSLRRRRLASLVRLLRRYYEIVRLPNDVHAGRGA